MSGNATISHYRGVPLLPWAHFASVLPKFEEARTAAHNRVRKQILSLLVKILQDRWELNEETRIANTGLRLSSVSVVCMEVSGRPLLDHQDGTLCVCRLQLDLVLVFAWEYRRCESE
jgi:hypothetical protein